MAGDDALSALYVAGPGGGRRYILLDGLVSIGRGAGASIVVDDPRVSRMHAAMQVGAQIALTDLNSANGTFRGGRRLSPHEPCPIDGEQPIFIGDSTLVVRRTPLSCACPQRITRFEEAQARLSREPRDGSGLILARVRSEGPIRRRAWEAILGEELRGPSDWLMWRGRDDLVLGTPGRGDRDASTFESRVSHSLASWGLTGDVEARFLSREELDHAGSDLGALLTADTRLTLARGAVILGHPAMAALKATVARIAPATVNVLVLGETGVGKDVIASMIHELSPRATKPFVRLNCATIPEPLLENELFGHEPGAFTGAVGAKPGLLEAAHGGTVFLDEVGDLPFPLQAKLLRAIESHEVLRIGGLRPRSVDVRFVAATNRELAAEVGAGRFRRDLFYRLNTMTIIVPPLRDRRCDIAPLAKLLLEQACARFSLARREMGRATVEALSAYPWPGNVRELRNVMERAALLSPGTVIEPDHLGLPSSAFPSSMASLTEDERTRTKAISERDRIEQALRAAGGNQSKAARILGTPRRTLVRRIASFGLPRPRSSAD